MLKFIVSCVSEREPESLLETIFDQINSRGEYTISICIINDSAKCLKVLFSLTGGITEENYKIYRTTACERNAARVLIILDQVLNDKIFVKRMKVNWSYVSALEAKLFTPVKKK